MLSNKDTGWATYAAGGIAAVGAAGLVYKFITRKSKPSSKKLAVREREDESKSEKQTSLITNNFASQLQHQAEPPSRVVAPEEMQFSIDGTATVRVTRHGVDVVTTGTKTSVTASFQEGDKLSAVKIIGDTESKYSKSAGISARTHTPESKIQFVSGSTSTITRALTFQKGPFLALTTSQSINSPISAENNKAFYIRKEIFEAEEISFPYTKAVAILINKDQAFEIPTGVSNKFGFFTSFTLNDQIQSSYKFPLGDKEPYRDQGIFGVGTGFLGAEDKIITAGHCIGSDFKDYYVVFNFYASMVIDKKDQDPNIPTSAKKLAYIENSDVYTMIKVLGRTFEQKSLANPDPRDWAVVQLDRKVQNVPIPKRGNGMPAEGAPLYIVGHPLGLPMKIDVGARVKNINNKHSFTATLAAYKGNSGSPVFNFNTNEVEGILVRGNDDFIMSEDGTYVQHATYSDTEYEGEECSRISEVETALRSVMK